MRNEFHGNARISHFANHTFFPANISDNPAFGIKTISLILKQWNFLPFAVSQLYTISQENIPQVCQTDYQCLITLRMSVLHDRENLATYFN